MWPDLLRLHLDEVSLRVDLALHDADVLVDLAESQLRESTVADPALWDLSGKGMVMYHPSQHPYQEKLFSLMNCEL